MKVLIDTREKTALTFNHPDIQVERCKLDCGDYGFVFDDGTMSAVCFERKSQCDLWGSLTKGYPRIKEEIIRAKENGITLIIIVECSLTKVLGGFCRSEVKGVSIAKTLFSLWTRYGIFPVFCKDKEESAEYITHYFWAEQRKKNEKILDKENISGKVSK